MTVQCCKCKRVRDGKAWAYPLGKPEAPVSHTYCPPCAEIFQIEIFSSQASHATRLKIGWAAEVIGRAAASA